MPRANESSKRAYNRTFQAERHARLKAEGKCLWCGKLPGKPCKPSKRNPTGIGCRCVDCSKKAAGWSTKSMRRKRPACRALGICVLCLKRIAMEGDTRCAFCAEAQDEYKATRHLEMAS